MPSPSYRFIDPTALAALHDLDLVARTVVDGFMYGVHQSRMPGAGLEFSQYRSYQPGDDLRKLDWRLLARSDRYFIRESETETSITVRIVLDASRSMAHEEGGVSKFDYARFLAASLAVLAHRQGDAVGLYALSAGAARVVRPDRTQQHLHRILHELEKLDPAGVWPQWREVEAALLPADGRGITVIISDLHQHAQEIRAAARTLTALRHEVLIAHLVGRQELEFGYEGIVTFEDLETGGQVDVDTGSEQVKAAYLTALEREHRDQMEGFAERRIDYGRFLIDQPLDDALRKFLGSRQRLA